MKRILVFDLGGVLIRLKEPDVFTVWLRENCRAGSVTPVLESSVSEKVQRGLWTCRRVYGELVRQADLRAPWQVFRERFSDCVLAEVTPGVGEMLRQLKSSFRIVMLSNTNAEHIRFQRDRTPGLFRVFDRLYFSHQLRSVKPEEGIFRSVMKRERGGADRFRLIDDTPENCATASALGWAVTPVERNRFDPEGFLRSLPV